MNWLIDYQHDPEMSQEYFFGWRPSYKFLLEIDSPKIVEIGVLEGFLTNQALKYLKFGKYYLVDPYKKYTKADAGDLHLHEQVFWDELYLRTRERFKDREEIEFIRKTSEEASKDFADESLDFVYIDADHTYKGIWKDLNCWYPKLKKGCLIAGHDIHEVPVQSAVFRFFCEVCKDQEGIVDWQYNDWWFKKI